MSHRVVINPAIVAAFSGAIAVIAPNAVIAGPALDEARFFGSPHNPPTVQVKAENGRWVTMLSGGITYRFSYFVKANRALDVIRVGTNSRPTGFSRGNIAGGRLTGQRTAWGDSSFFVPNGELGEDRATVLKACNDLLAQGKTTFERHETFANLPLVGEVTVAIAFGRKHIFSRLAGATMVKVICEPEPEPPAEILRFTVAADPSDQSCPKDHQLEVSFRRPRLDGENKANIKFRIVIDGEAGEPIVKQMSVRDDASFVVKHVETLKLDPGKHRIKVKVVGGPESEERIVTVQCPAMRVTSIALEYTVGLATCPKLVFETTALYTTRPGKVTYRIVNPSGEVEFSQQVEARRSGNRYKAVGQRVMKLGAHTGDYMAVDRDNPKVHSNWEQLVITCS
jgi:hypothetical protein